MQELVKNYHLNGGIPMCAMKLDLRKALLGVSIGFSLYRMRFEVVEKSEDWYITRSTVEYEVKEADDDQVAANNASSTKLLLSILAAAKNYLVNNNNMNDK